MCVLILRYEQWEYSHVFFSSSILLANADQAATHKHQRYQFFINMYILSSKQCYHFNIELWKVFFFFFFPWWIFSHDSLENQSRLLFLVQITHSVSHAWHCLLCIEESQSSHLDFLNNVFTFHLTQILPNSLKDKHTDISIHFYKLSLLLYLISDIRPAF